MRGFSETKCSASSRVGKEATLQYLHSRGTRIKADPELTPKEPEAPLTLHPNLLGVGGKSEKSSLLMLVNPSSQLPEIL